MSYSELDRDRDYHVRAPSFTGSMDEDRSYPTSHVGDDADSGHESSVRPSIETDHYEVTHSEMDVTPSEETDKHAMLSDSTRQPSHSEDEEPPYVDRSATVDDRASYTSDSTWAPSRDAEISSQRHEGLEEDVFTDERPRSSSGSFDARSEQGTTVDGDNLTTITHSSPRSPHALPVSHFDREEYNPASREASHSLFRASFDSQALSLASPPASVVSSTRSSRKQFPTVSRLGTPIASAQYNPKRMITPARFKSRSDAPLVLLHVTLLPLRWTWGDILNNVDPADMSSEAVSLRNAWRMLQDRVGDTVIERGVLISHPQNDFEVLEERLLEALELPVRRRARILECGHYYGPSNEVSIADDNTDEDESNDQRRSESKRRWCGTCKSEFRYDPPTKSKVFRVNVYASTGLMRAGAWEACWKEMERVDVEVEPIVEPNLQDELVHLSAARYEREMSQADIAKSRAQSCSLSPESAHEARLRETYGGTPPRQAFHSREASLNASDRGDSTSPSTRSRNLLVRFGYLVLQDSRNMIILVLSLLVVGLLVRSAQVEPPYEPVIHVMKTIPKVSNVYTHSPDDTSLSSPETFIASNGNRKVYCSSPGSPFSPGVTRDWEIIVPEDAQEAEAVIDKKIVTVTETETLTHTHTEFTMATPIESILLDPLRTQLLEMWFEDEIIHSEECAATPILEPEPECAAKSVAQFVDVFAEVPDEHIYDDIAESPAEQEEVQVE